MRTMKCDSAPPPREKMLEKMAALCARSEQCEADLRARMRLKGMSRQDADSIIAYLYEKRFLDIERFAGAYARDKFRYSRWGRIKIRMMLASKQIPSYAVKTALESIDEDEYYGMLLSLVQAGRRGLDLEAPADRQKLLRRLYARGFEPALINEAITRLRCQG